MRSPLKRFRTKPQKPLSVTDLVSPAWCELQYWFTLTEFGRKPRTQAMRQGSKVHRLLEEQVHTFVPVQVKTKEDRFGLKIWNTIQGLRTLKETGLTRELEVWGVINGQVVNGIIDEISYACPDRDMEQQLEMKKAGRSDRTTPLGQLKIEQSLSRCTNSGPGPSELERQVYITDVKTRGVKSLPKGASLRPTWMQLMLYRKLLESLSLNTVDAETIFARYDLGPLEPFSEIFTGEVRHISNGSLEEIEDRNEEAALLTKLAEKAENPFATSQVTEVQTHNCLLALWSLMISQFQETTTLFSDILRAEFRYSKTGEVIGSSLTIYDEKIIQEYVDKEMQWWRGEREARGVEIEEAFKCQMCDFAHQCEWRQAKVEEALERSRLRSKAKGKSIV